MGLWRGQYRGTDIGWNSPVKEPVHPSFVNQLARNGLGWLTGFNEFICRCGLSSNGIPGIDLVADNTGKKTETPLTLHGKIANIPAHFVEISSTTEAGGLLSVTGIVDEASMYGPCLRLKTTYETVPGSNKLTIRDEVTNRGGQPTEMQLLYHTNVGKPILEAGTRVVLPIREAAPRDARAAEDHGNWQTYLGPTPGYTEQCYFAELIGDDRDRTSVLLRNASGDRGITLEFGIRELPCFTLWKCTQAESDGYVTGVEPATNFPNLKTFERKHGRVRNLAPGESYATHIDVTVLASAGEVSAAEKRITDLQNRAHAVVHKEPIAKFSPST